MEKEAFILLVMCTIFAGGCFALKLPVALSLVFSSVAGALVAGEGVPLRHLVEGTFSFLDTNIVIATAMIYMKVLQKSGVLDTIGRQMTEAFYKKPYLLLCSLMLLIMFPGMITGSSTACVFTTGALVAPVLMHMGIPRINTAAIIAIGAMLGMIAPPVCIPAMIIGEGIDMPYVGFFFPLFILTFPLGIIFVLTMARRYVKKDIDLESLVAEMPESFYGRYGFRIYLPLILLFVLMVVPKAAPKIIYDPGLPFDFLLATLTGLFTANRINFFQTVREAMREAIPVMGILVGVGMFIQIITLTGARGFIVGEALSLPKFLLLFAVATSIPAFGAVSAFGAASVLGVPLALALLGKNQILAVSALALVSSLGDLMPPTALAGLFAAKVMKVDNYFRVLYRCLIPAIVIDAVGILALAYANWGRLLPW
ncbi:MAG: TRAP transporter large permease subunit [Desulfobacteraceae bacterium]|nr:MAG: TRAP transporter large permease subunit [Desulfobacteraceae bacterium]